MKEYSMKINLLIAALSLFILSFMPLPMRSNRAVYNTWSNSIYCTEGYCIHEIAHALDDEAGWISSSDDFKNTANEMDLDLWRWREFPAWSYKETYAELFVMAEGRKELMPERLQNFYDWELADRLMEKYNG
jgi:hypothetical protein